MRQTLVWLGALLLLPAAGAPLLARRTFRRFAPASRLVLAGAVGAVVTSFTMTLASLLGWRWMGLPVLAGAALVASAAAALLRPDSARGGDAPAAGVVGAEGAVLSALAVAAALGATLAGVATSVDLFFFWGPKAQQFAIARGIDAGYLAEPSHAFMHAYYPPLVANLGAYAAMASGGFSWSGALATFPLLLGALAIALPRALDRRDAQASAATALAVAAIALLGIRAGIAGNGDMPLVFFESLAMALLLRRDAPDPPVQWLAGLLLAGAAATKVEGLPFALAASLLFVALREASGSRLRATARLLAPTALSLGVWFAFGLRSGLFHEYSEYGPFWTVYLAHLPRVLSAEAAALAGASRGLPFLVPALCLVAAGRPTRDFWLPIGTAAALAGFSIFAYLHAAGEARDWIGWSAPRVLMPVPVLLALALSVARRPEVQASVAAPTDDRRRAAAWLLGAAAVLVLPAMHYLLPLGPDVLALPVSPVDRVDVERGRQWIFLDSCRAHLPAGARVSVIAADGETEMALFMTAIGLFPDDTVVPHSYYGRATPEAFARAEWILVYGAHEPRLEDAELVARTADGAVYRRRRAGA